MAAAALIAPARLPLTPNNNSSSPSTSLSLTSPTPDADPIVHEDPDDTSLAIHLQHDYLRSLIVGQHQCARTRPSHASRGTVFCVNLPDTFSLPGLSQGYTALGISVDAAMAATTAGRMLHHGSLDESEPSSPPELSYSKSSKSSSSIPSDDDMSDGMPDRSTHFEEVSLDDMRRDSRDSADDSNLPPDSRPTLRRPPPKSFTTSDVRMSGTIPPLRQRPNGLSRGEKFPPLQTSTGPLQDQSLNLPNGRTMLRSTSTPTSPYYPQRLSSRSPSPNKPFSQKGFSVSTQTLGSTTSSEGGVVNTKPWPRRMSWQPGRKTVAELEAEYNDADEEVPEEAILENVPISPMPGQYTYSRSSSMGSFNHPGLRSTTPSPQRKPSYANLHSANSPKNAKRPSAPPAANKGSYVPSRSPHRPRPSLPHSATVGQFPPDHMNSKAYRSKSWSEDLSEEARAVSQALEEYAERLSDEKRRSGTSSAANSPPRPSIKKTRTSVSVTEIPTVPAVQRGNIMIDPLPISKEKEAVLTRTRPSWLPPKDKKEEKRHLKEFQKMMARAAEAEKKRAVLDQERQENKEELQYSIARIWDQHVLPNWDNVIKEPRTRELWWRGVTPRSRGDVWQRAIGNELGLSAVSYKAALSRANALEETVAEMPDEERAHSKEAAWFEAIERDVPCVFPELNMFQVGAPLHDALRDVLKAYTMYRSDVGYVYGTHLVAGVLCIILQPADAFVVLANLLNRPLPLAFLVHDQVAMARTYELVLGTLKYKFTRLHDHLTSPALNLAPAEYLDPIFRCLFAHSLPYEMVQRIWDVFAFEGDKTLIRAAVAVLGRLESKLYGNKEEILDYISWRNERKWDVGGEEDFVQAMREAGKVDGKGERIS